MKITDITNEGCYIARRSCVRKGYKQRMNSYKLSPFLVLTQERSNYNTSKGRPTPVHPTKACGGEGSGSTPQPFM